MRKRGLLITGTVIPLITAFAGLMSAQKLCACIPLEWSVKKLVGASPIEDPERFRTNLLQKIPPGTRAYEINRMLGALTTGHLVLSDDFVKKPGYDAKSAKEAEEQVYQRNMNKLARICTTDAINMECRFSLESKWFGQNRIGYVVRVELDHTSHLKDLHVTPFSIWWQ